MSVPAPSDRNLLFAMLALHNALISREQAIDAMQAWVADRSRSVPELLIDRHQLATGDRLLVEQLVERHLARHDGDVEQSISSLPAVSGLTPTTDDHRGGSSDFSSVIDGVQRFRVLKPHASGGLGEVSVALDEQLGREVALKQIREQHADDPQSRARFLREATITGRLEHPGIVPIYGLDADESGRPRYAMRFVRGDSLQAAVERFHAADGPGRDESERTRALRDLLRRFVDVCNAVAYAHSKGVIHRDLKPANVMLGEYGETLVVDWGLARVLGQVEGVTQPHEGIETPSEEQLTQAGQMIGTPNYMPPEQARGEIESVGMAADVFALGATLYCILTGKPPYRGGRDEVREQARACRATPARQANPRTPPALDAVCRKAMSSRPEDRYLGARELAHEVECWLADEPVGAHPEPVGARLRRWAKRNRTLTAMAAVLLLLALPLAVALAAVSDRARRRAEADRTRIEEEEKASARLGKRRMRISGFYERYVLAAPRPLGKDNTHDVSMRQALDQALPEIARTFGDEPEDEMSVSVTLGTTYLSLGDFVKAERLLRKARALAVQLRSDHDRDTLSITTSLEQALIFQGKTEEAETLIANGYEAARDALGPEDPVTLMFQHDLSFLRAEQGRYLESERLSRELIPIRARALGKNHSNTLATEYNLSSVLASQGKSTDAESLLARLVPRYETVMGPDHSETLRVASQWATMLGELYQFEQAEQIQRRLLPKMAKVLGPEHPATLSCRHNLSSSLLERGQSEEAERILRELVPIRSRVCGAKHPDSLSSQHLLGWCLYQRGETTEAAKWIESSASGLLEARGPEHRETLIARAAWAYLQSESQPQKAEELFTELLPLMDRVLGPEHPMTMTARHNFAHCLSIRNKHAEAEAILRKLLPLRERVRGPRHPDALASLFALSNSLAQRGKFVEAARLAQAAAEGMRATRGPDHRETLIIGAGHGFMLVHRRPEQAEELFTELLPRMDRVLHPEHPSTLAARHNLAISLASQKKFVEAEAILSKLVPLRAKVRGPEHADTLYSTLALADVLLARDKLDEAQKILRDLLPVVAKKAVPGDPLLIAARGRLLTLYLLERRFADAIPLLEPTLKDAEKQFPEEYLTLAGMRATLGWALLETGKPDEAEPLLRRALQDRKKLMPIGNWQTANTQTLLGGALAVQKKFDEAEKLLLSGYRGLSEAKGYPPERLAEAHARIVKLYTDWGKPDKAAEWQKKKPSSAKDASPKKDK